MKCYSIAVRLALAAFAIVAIADAATAGEMAPFNGTLEGSFTATSTPPPSINRQLNATGKATLLGDFTYDFPHSVDRSVTPATGIGYSNFTAANGDKVFAFITGQATLAIPGMLHAVENGTILGGTGRFTNASGSFVIDRSIDTVKLTTIGSFDGTIFSPGASKRAGLAPVVAVPEPATLVLLALFTPLLVWRNLFRSIALGVHAGR
jgi:hypothetical protein